MKRDFDAIARENFDLIVIGGGIIGTGIARDASLRGIKTLLIEKEDFGYGTTSRSSRLIHGGLRYLRMLEFHLVGQDLHEREVLLKIAPHLVHPFPFIIPITSLYYQIALSIGVRMYDVMASGKSMLSHQHLSRREALETEPELEELKGLRGAILYYDCQAPFTERLGIENVLSAAEHGATIINHAQLTGFLRDGNDVCGIEALDCLSGEVYRVKARLVVNAAGHWVDCVRDLLHGGPASIVRRTKGIHLLTPKLSQKALVLFSPVDGRLFFVMPWLDYTLIGTTDTDYSGDLDAVCADEKDVAYLLQGARQVFPKLRSEDVLYTIAGLRSLVHIGGEKPSDITREHKVLDHKQRDGIEGLISVLGGKITAYRAVAKDAVDVVCRKLGLKATCTTAEVPLPGAPAVSQKTVVEAAKESGLSVETVTHLADLYGSCFSQVLELVRRDKRGGQPLCPHCPDILSQVEHSVKEESALTVADFLLRRSAIGLGACQGLDAVETVAQEMGRVLGWSKTEQQRQVEAYRAQAALCQHFRAGSRKRSRQTKKV
ncbi:MAG: glycerol-3-phosphate dehydrogenase/oxidase [Chloroflexi bacterium]|nr:glycerol-3-phosphate dehydrogenase/oxidase [Chloroflexota bacterium]